MATQKELNSAINEVHAFRHKIDAEIILLEEKIKALKERKEKGTMNFLDKIDNLRKSLTEVKNE